ncbi:MAG: hypothetical protein JO104_09575 [Candidatus Eremiobacteraeota bacterium]|nr:hypothetical protein [Candidatus Eremiobacteraeota bacterium]
MRLLFFVVLGAALLFVMPCARVWASEVEFCPARLDAFHAFHGSNDGLIAFYVAAESARSVSANVIVQSESNWYTFQFKDAALVPDLAHYESPTVRFDRTLYHTKPLYVQLPAGERILRWWIYDATSTGDSVFGWDDKGDVTCFPPPEGDTKIPPLAHPPRRVNPRNDLEQLPALSDKILAASKIAAPADITECVEPFVPATVVHAFQPSWPAGVPRLSAAVVSEIEVAINANGSLAGAWVYTPSGYPDLDLEALKAAGLSKYRGGIALCKPAPGTYLFRADFDPN